MNVWKPVALVAVAGLVTSIGVQVAHAQACNNQVNMANALTALQSAHASLQKAEHNKGGWRDAALAATETAIKETNRGCAVANH